MSSVREKGFSRRGDTDFKAKTGQKIFIVEVDSPGDDPLNVGGLPVRDELYAIGDTRKCDRLIVSAALSDSITFEVTALYSSDRRFTAPNIPVRIKDIDFDYAAMEAPAFEEIRRKYRVENQEQIKSTFQPKASYIVRFTQLVVIIRVLVNSFTTTDLRSIRSQVGKFHSLGDEELFQFQGGTTKTRGQETEITYTWVGDNGNAAAGTGQVQGTSPFQYILPPSRLPWHRYLVKGTDESGSSPEIMTILDFKSSDVVMNGAYGLPGGPLG
jgi:hypothetical protein